MMHDKARRRHEKAMREATDPIQLDFLLDQYADSVLRATEWDADQWGLPSSREMRDDLGALEAIARHKGLPDYPREVI